MTWLVWRQHRYQAYAGAAALAALAVLLLITGLGMAGQYHAALVACAAGHTCGSLGSTLSLGSPVMTTVVTLTLAVPALLGVFWGAPLVARELETGTSHFAWMQSVTRRRWLAVKTGWVLLAATAWGGAVSALVTWWSSPLNALKQDRFRPGQFDTQGIVPVGYALFAVAVGVAAGLLIRRTLPALVATLGVFGVTRILIAYFARQHYLPPVTLVHRPGQPAAAAGPYWQLASGVIGPGGHVYSTSGGLSTFLGSTRTTIMNGCIGPARSARPGTVAQKVTACMNAHGYREFLTVQPAGRYWPFQGIETGIFVLFAASLLAVAAVAVGRREA